MFKVNDRIEFTANLGLCKKIGDRGTVILIDEYGDIGIELDNFTGVHFQHVL